MAQFIIHNDEYESGYLEGVQENLAITSQAGFAPIAVTSEAVKGDFEKETIFTGDVTFQNRDPAGNAARTTETFGIDENVGVKVSYNTPKQKIPLADLNRSNFDSMAYSNAMGRNVAQNEIKHVLDIAITAAVAAIKATSPAAPDSTFIANAATFTKEDFVVAMEPLLDQAVNLEGWLMHTGLGFDVLKEASVKNRFGEAGVVYGALPGTFNIPALTSALPALTNGTKRLMLGLFADAIKIKLNSTAPSVVIRDNDDGENHFQTWSMDGACNLLLRNVSYTGAGGSVTKALLANAANWKALGSDTNLLGTLTEFGA